MSLIPRFLIFSLLMSLCSTLATASQLPFKVVVDAGHGGIDTGAVMGRVRESEIALKVAIALKRRLALDSRFEAYLTRESDKSLSLPERVKKADALNADLLLSIHANASPDPRAKGVEFYFQNQLAPDEESLFLAAHEHTGEKSAQAAEIPVNTAENDVLAIVEDLKRQERQRSSFQLTKVFAQIWKNGGSNLSRAIRQAPFYVISKPERPAVLVEIGFITHPTEGPNLARKDNQEEIAEKIYRGLVEYHQVKLPTQARSAAELTPN